MTREDIAHEIALDLLGTDTLDRHNFNYDNDAVVAYVQEVILEHLRDYTLLSGEVF